MAGKESPRKKEERTKGPATSPSPSRFLSIFKKKKRFSLEHLKCVLLLSLASLSTHARACVGSRALLAFPSLSYTSPTPLFV